MWPFTKKTPKTDPKNLLNKFNERRRKAGKREVTPSQYARFVQSRRRDEYSSLNNDDDILDLLMLQYVDSVYSTPSYSSPSYEPTPSRSDDDGYSSRRDYSSSDGYSSSSSSSYDSGSSSSSSSDSGGSSSSD